MIAIYKREISAYFKGMFGYVVAVFLLLFTASTRWSITWRPDIQTLNMF